MKIMKKHKPQLFAFTKLTAVRKKNLVNVPAGTIGRYDSETQLWSDRTIVTAGSGGGGTFGETHCNIAPPGLPPYYVTDDGAST